MIVSAIAISPLYALKESIMQNGEIVRQTVGTVFDMWQKLAFTGVLVSSFILLFQNKRFSKAVDSLRFYGKMSLTNYIIQSIVGAIIYFPFGLYLAPYCGAAASLLIGCVVFLIQAKLCR